MKVVPRRIQKVLALNATPKSIEWLLVNLLILIVYVMMDLLMIK